MLDRYLLFVRGEPGSLHRRLFDTVSMLCRAVLLGFMASILICLVFRYQISQSDWIGAAFCGEGQHIDQIGSGRRSWQIICRDRLGNNLGPNENFLSALALPVIVLFAGFSLYAIWWPGVREQKQSRT